MENLSNEKRVVYMNLSTSLLSSGTPYQRTIMQKKIECIISNFDEHRIGILKVSHRDGKYWVYDGQHRLIALKALNDGKDCIVPCEVHIGLTYEEEARLFATQKDGEVQVGAIAKAKALLEAKDHEMIELKNIVESVGLGLSFTLNKSNNKITAVSKLRKTFRDLKGEGTKTVLSLIKNVWEGEASSLDKEILGGVALFYKTYKTEFDTNTFIRNLKKVDPVLIKRKGSIDYSAKMDLRFAKVIFDCYNANLKMNRLEYKFKG